MINRSNYDAALEAIRDILLMYADMAESYSSFGHAIDVAIRFDPLTYVDCKIERDVSFIDINLLRSGSAIAILAYFYDLWCEFEQVDCQQVSRSNEFKDALSNGRLSGFPDIEEVLSEALERNEMPLSDPWFDKAVQPIYKKYVANFFLRLASIDR